MGIRPPGHRPHIDLAPQCLEVADAQYQVDIGVVFLLPAQSSTYHQILMAVDIAEDGYGLAHDRFMRLLGVDFLLQVGQAFQDIIEGWGFVEEHDLHGLVVAAQV